MKKRNTIYAMSIIAIISLLMLGCTSRQGTCETGYHEYETGKCCTDADRDNVCDDAPEQKGVPTGQDPKNKDLCSGDRCCSNEDCQEKKGQRAVCVNPRTQESECTWTTEDECITDDQCEDEYDSTEDRCDTSAMPSRCRHTKIEQCITGDGYCPKGCDTRDEDCEETIKDCHSDIVCFIGRAETCAPAVVLIKSTFETGGIMKTTTTTLEIKGPIGKSCQYEQNTEDVQVMFSERYRQTLADSGKTEEDISGMEDAEIENAMAEGVRSECAIKASELTAMLARLESGEISALDFNEGCD